MKNIIKGPNCAETQIGPNEFKNFLLEINNTKGFTNSQILFAIWINIANCIKKKDKYGVQRLLNIYSMVTKK